MSKLVLLLIVLAPVVATSDSAQLSAPLIDALTPVDSVASHADLESVFASEHDAAQKLCDITNDVEADPGIQLRAIHALTQYRAADVAPADPHAALFGILTTDRYRLATAGSDVLILAAAIQALGAYPDKGPDDVTTILTFLSNPSRDIRLATAHALRDAKNPAANKALSDQLVHEPVKQVQNAIDEALRVIGEPD